MFFAVHDKIKTYKEELFYRVRIHITAAIIKCYTSDNQPIIFATQRGYGDSVEWLPADAELIEKIRVVI